ncbi:hypothetical protein MUP77_08380 [Candidatus Bathyarchaeota archaeon]|nr:hypothetical protein [Candidatus Bathyarchaeota archaeon]
MEVVSVCVQCQHQNKHEVDNNGRATVTCSSCSTVYTVQSYEVRAKGGRRDRSSGIKHYSVRVKEPDRDETMLEFSSSQEIEMRAGDWITGSYNSKGKLKYLLNHKINRYWDVQQGMGCLGRTAMFITLIGITITCVVLVTIFLT